MWKEYDLNQSEKEDNFQDFNELFYRYQRKLFIYSYKIIFNEKDAEEIVQEVFLKIWEQQSFMDKSINIDSYIFDLVQPIIYAKIKKNITSTSS